MPTDLNTLDDWWNEGFDGFLEGRIMTAVDLTSAGEGISDTNFGALLNGWLSAGDYADAVRPQGQER